MDRVGPYLTHVVKHHGQTTLIPPQNLGRIRRVNDGKRVKGTKFEPSRDSNLSEPHEKFQKRYTPNEYEDTPSYPPPSFEEATSSSSSGMYSHENRNVACNISSSSPLPPASCTRNNTQILRGGSRTTQVNQISQNGVRNSDSSPIEGSFQQSTGEIQLQSPISINQRVQILDGINPMLTVSGLMSDISFSSTPEHFTPPSELEFTDLDVHLSHLNNDASVANGDSYNDLLALSEIIGPASESSVQVYGFDLPVGKVEVERRRVMKDGRVKIKLSFLGLAVDKCSICLVQFKKDDFAALTTCEHVFHERCMRSWLLRSKTCPLCRQVVDTY